MKLISKTLLYYLLVSLPLLLIAGIFGYYLISMELTDGLDEALWKEKSYIEKALDNKLNPENLKLSGLSDVTVVPDNRTGFSYFNRIVYDSLERENITYRVISSYYKRQGQNYKIEIAQPTMEEEELKEGLLSALAVIVAFLIIAFFMLSWLLSKTLWRPFYKTLEQLEAYEIKDQAVVTFERTSTREFTQLNTVILQMMQKMQRDFVQQKEFTENAAHEMQTPLAVIKANIGLLIQSPHLASEEMNQIQAIENTTKKMASLNKALLLLAKIENYQFKETATINLNKLIRNEYEHVTDLIEAREIKVVDNMQEQLNIRMSPVLAEVLLTNLFQNAIRHNVSGGSILLETTKDTFTISNSGEPLKVNSDELFTRFKKNEASKDSVGLGLAIVKSICTVYHTDILYTNSNALHIFKLKFK